MDSVGRDGAKKALTDRANWKRDEAAQLGTDIHHWADQMITGQPLPALVGDGEAVHRALCPMVEPRRMAAPPIRSRRPLSLRRRGARRLWRYLRPAVL